MRTFFRENKGKLILLLISSLCLVGLWQINIYQALYSLTPWKNLGAPPAEISSINFVSFSSINQKNSEPIVYVFSADQNWYGCCSTFPDKWKPLTFSFREKSEHGLRGYRMCAITIEQDWQLTPYKNDGAKKVVSYGECMSISRQYVVYQIKKDGSLWEKYIDGKTPEQFRNILTPILLLSIVLSILLVWPRGPKKQDFLEPSADFTAK